jgi:hypothetical protein
MQKLGHSLRDIPGFEPSVLARLRDEFSVTTAEELVGLWRSVPQQIGSVLGGSAAQLAEAAQRLLGPEALQNLARSEQSNYPFQTGHEAPPAGKTRY